jgi:hypothetical protein
VGQLLGIRDLRARPGPERRGRVRIERAAVDLEAGPGGQAEGTGLGQQDVVPERLGQAVEGAARAAAAVALVGLRPEQGARASRPWGRSVTAR